MNAICLVIDRLHAGYLGCYGNRWVQTPEFDRLAAESFVFDHATLDSPELSALYRSWWHAQHACEPSLVATPHASLIARLQQQGIATGFLTDDPAALAALPADIAAELKPLLIDEPLPSEPARDSRRAHLQHMFDAGLTWLETATSPFLLWLHVGSLGLTWDAPLELREHYRAEEDPEFAQGVEVPRFVLPTNYDPDQLQAILQAYAAQVTLCDEHVGHFVDCIRDSSLASDTLITVVGGRGLPLGEHRRVGPFDEALCGELIHTPWLMRFPDRLGALCRSSALVQPGDLGATLAEWFGVPAQEPASRVARSLLPLIRDEAPTWRERAIVVNSQGEQGIRTARWYLRQTGEQPAPGDEPDRAAAADVATSRVYLYAKPDDRFEVNDVIDRCADVAVSLQQALTAFTSACEHGTLANLPPLPEQVTARPV